MRILAKESKKPDLQAEKARSLALAVIDAEKRLNTLRNSFEEEKARLSESFSSLQRDIEGKSFSLKTDIQSLEARRMAAVRPIIDEMKEAARRSDEAAKAENRAAKAFQELETKETALAARDMACDERQKKIVEMESVISELLVVAKERKLQSETAYVKAKETIEGLSNVLLGREKLLDGREQRLKADRVHLEAEMGRLEGERLESARAADKLVEERRKLGTVIAEMKSKGVWHQGS